MPSAFLQLSVSYCRMPSARETGWFHNLGYCSWLRPILTGTVPTFWMLGLACSCGLAQLSVIVSAWKSSDGQTLLLCQKLQWVACPCFLLIDLTCAFSHGPLVLFPDWAAWIRKPNIRQTAHFYRLPAGPETLPGRPDCAQVGSALSALNPSYLELLIPDWLHLFFVGRTAGIVTCSFNSWWRTAQSPLTLTMNSCSICKKKSKPNTY